MQYSVDVTGQVLDSFPTNILTFSLIKCELAKYLCQYNLVCIICNNKVITWQYINYFICCFMKIEVFCGKQLKFRNIVWLFFLWTVTKKNTNSWPSIKENILQYSIPNRRGALRWSLGVWGDSFLTYSYAEWVTQWYWY